MKLVVVESPYAGDIETNIEYAQEAMADCFARGEAPFASHMLYPGTLDDDVEDQRTLGINAGFAWGEKAELTAVYTDRGISRGMREGIDAATRVGRPVEYRSLPRWATNG